jgi:hypothetical protein
VIADKYLPRIYAALLAIAVIMTAGTVLLYGTAPLWLLGVWVIAAVLALLGFRWMAADSDQRGETARRALEYIAAQERLCADHRWIIERVAMFHPYTITRVRAELADRARRGLDDNPAPAPARRGPGRHHRARFDN